MDSLDCSSDKHAKRVFELVDAQISNTIAQVILGENAQIKLIQKIYRYCRNCDHLTELRRSLQYLETSFPNKNRYLAQLRSMASYKGIAGNSCASARKFYASGVEISKTFGRVFFTFHRRVTDALNQKDQNVDGLASIAHDLSGLIDYTTNGTQVAVGLLDNAVDNANCRRNELSDKSQLDVTKAMNTLTSSQIYMMGHLAKIERSILSIGQ